MAAKGTLVNVLKETEITMGSALLDEKHRPKFFGFPELPRSLRDCEDSIEILLVLRCLCVHYQSFANARSKENCAVD